MRTILVIAALAACAAAAAHHSYAEFDMTSTAVVKGTVAKVEWINPPWGAAA